MTSIVNIYKQTDSSKAKFSKTALSKKGAAIRTRVRMNSTWNALVDYAKENGWGHFDPMSLTLKQLKSYVAHRLEKGISARSMQNEMSHIRRALVAVGRTEFDAKNLRNLDLGIPKGTRIGGGKIVDADVLAIAVANALPDTKALIQLSRFVGLRELEAVMAMNSLAQWERDLAEGRPIIVREGTKGGRARSVVIAGQMLGKALEAVQAGLAVLQKQDYLVVSISLKAALEQHSDRLAKLALKGENSCHSLRRAFAMDQYQHYISQGCSDKVALSRTSNDLGHGDGRGRWVYNNYLRATLKDESFHYNDYYRKTQGLIL